MTRQITTRIEMRKRIESTKQSGTLHIISFHSNMNMYFLRR
jgi:hypothetical protein